MNGVEQLARHGDVGLQLGVAPGDELIEEGLDVRFALHRHQRRHVENPADGGVASPPPSPSASGGTVEVVLLDVVVLVLVVVVGVGSIKRVNEPELSPHPQSAIQESRGAAGPGPRRPGTCRETTSGSRTRSNR